jgi:hypothetical protein
MVADLLPLTMMLLYTFGRPSSTIALRGPPSECKLLRNLCCPADELVIVERFDILVDLIRSKDLVVISIYFEDLLVIWLLKF